MTKLCCRFRLQTRKLGIDHGDCCCFRLQTHKLGIHCGEVVIHRLAKCAKTLVHRSAQPVERLVRHVEPLAQRVELLIHRVAQRVKSPIDAAEACIPDHHSLGGSLSGRFIRPTLWRKAPYSSESIAVNAIIVSSCAVDHNKLCPTRCDTGGRADRAWMA